jgi:hypothetical protein
MTTLTRPTDNEGDPAGVKSELLANFLFQELVGEANATLPAVDLTDSKYDVPWDEDSAVFKPVEKPTIEELLAQFHALMGGVGIHIAKEFDAGRITGAKYADIYLALMQSSMQSAVQFLLGKDQAFWMAAKTQADAITAQMQNEVAKLQAMLARANYALTKLKLSTEDSQFGQSEYQRKDILPIQKIMVNEQAESQRAQTMDFRADDETVLKTNRWIDPTNAALGLQGLLGIQKALYTQQVKSYKDDTQLKATRVFADLWTTAKTIDEATPPLAYVLGTDSSDNAALDNILVAARTLALNGIPDNFTPSET